MEHFIEFNNKQYEHSQTVDPDNLAIFLFPGILGNGNELDSLAHAIDKIRKGRTPIYIYNQPLVNGAPTGKPLKEEAEAIAAEMRKLRGDTNLPYIMLGYSYGADLMHAVGQDLASKGFDPFKVAIDNAAPACVKTYIENDNDDFKKDLIKIINYAAKLSGIDVFLEPNDKTLVKLRNVELEERIDLISDEVLGLLTEDVSEDSLSAFNTYLEIAKQNLRNLAYSNTDNQVKTTDTHVILTSETSRKYGNGESPDINFTAGWDACSANVIRLNGHVTSKLWRQEHMDLLSEENAGLLAALITTTLKCKITPELLRKRHAEKTQTTDTLFNNLITKPKTSNYSPTYFSGYNQPASQPSPFFTIDSSVGSICQLDQTVEAKKNLKLR